MSAISVGGPVLSLTPNGAKQLHDALVAITSLEQAYNLGKLANKEQNLERGILEITEGREKAAVMGSFNDIFVKELGDTLPDRLWSVLKKVSSPDTVRESADDTVRLTYGNVEALDRAYEVLESLQNNNEVNSLLEVLDKIRMRDTAYVPGQNGHTWAGREEGLPLALTDRGLDSLTLVLSDLKIWGELVEHHKTDGDREVETSVDEILAAIKNIDVVSMTLNADVAKEMSDVYDILSNNETIASLVSEIDQKGPPEYDITKEDQVAQAVIELRNIVVRRDPLLVQRRNIQLGH